MLYAEQERRILTLDGLFTEWELVAMGNYGWANPIVRDNPSLVSLRNQPARSEMVIVAADHFPESEEVIETFDQLQLRRPTVEEALYFGMRYPEAQARRPIVFLHEPLRLPYSGAEVVIVLDAMYHGRARLLDAHYYKGARWGRKCVFPGIVL